MPSSLEVSSTIFIMASSRSRSPAGSRTAPIIFFEGRTGARIVRDDVDAFAGRRAAELLAVVREVEYRRLAFIAADE